MNIRGIDFDTVYVQFVGWILEVFRQCGIY
jgi:hypothetical protein